MLYNSTKLLLGGPLEKLMSQKLLQDIVDVYKTNNRKCSFLETVVGYCRSVQNYNQNIFCRRNYRRILYNSTKRLLKVFCVRNYRRKKCKSIKTITIKSFLSQKRSQNVVQQYKKRPSGKTYVVELIVRRCTRAQNYQQKVFRDGNYCKILYKYKKQSLRSFLHRTITNNFCCRRNYCRIFYNCRS